ncbi:unnamed protein product [Peniophora sp. CBMAI 1063]|nr:unnamed protein product [Peniophora sp. CBMAI 1063]
MFRRAVLPSFPRLRTYATIENTLVFPKPPPPAPAQAEPRIDSEPAQSALDRVLIDHLVRTPASSRPSLNSLINHYLERSGRVLPSQLPYESTPAPHRRVPDNVQDGAVQLLAHVVKEGDRTKLSLSSAFAIQPQSKPGVEAQPIIVSCAHTLEEIRWSPLLVLPASLPSAVAPDLDHVRSSASFLVSLAAGDESSIVSLAEGLQPAVCTPIQSIQSSLHRSDLMLASLPAQTPKLRTLPVSPYPAQTGTPIRAHLVSETRPSGPAGEGWQPWVGGWAKWVRGRVLGYRDLAGREAEPGTYDALSHMLFEPLPTPGSSGGPIVNEETGAVVGVMLSTRMYNHVEGTRGWGVPAEMIYEMFSLPGLNLARS